MAQGNKSVNRIVNYLSLVDQSCIFEHLTFFQSVNLLQFMENIAILWADDEIDLLKPHILFLKSKGYIVQTTSSGRDAIQICRENHFDLVFLDENMPGISGLAALQAIKADNPNLPVVMITKSEEEHIMEEAIGQQISDYLIKPVNPHQILLSIKKIIDNKRIYNEKTTQSYLQEFRQLGMEINDDMDHNGWVEVFQKLVQWEMRLEGVDDASLREVFEAQKVEANAQFGKMIKRQYRNWMQGKDQPILSHQAFQKLVMPFAEDGPLFLFMIDNLRLDQYKTLESTIAEYFRPESSICYYAMLPTATEFARNAFFSGMTPLEITQKHPQLWVEEGDEGSKNQHEEELLKLQLQRLGYTKKWSYHKVTNPQSGQQLIDQFHQWKKEDLVVIVYNFVDLLSHVRSEMNVLKQLAPDEAGYRSLTKSWFEHSPLFEMMKLVASMPNATMAITTDHGSIRCHQPSRIIGDKTTTSNLRFKEGRSLSFDDKDLYWEDQPEKIGLPKSTLSASYVFANEDKYFVYPNNYHHYVSMYRDSFQHGGISLEEMIVPFGIFTPR